MSHKKFIIFFEKIDIQKNCTKLIFRRKVSFCQSLAAQPLDCRLQAVFTL